MDDEERLDQNVYDIIYSACEKVEVSLDKNKIELTPKLKEVDAATSDVIGLVTEYWECHFMDLCKKFGLRDLCDHCENRFECWTQK
jgi:hypothetical protein